MDSEINQETNKNKNESVNIENCIIIGSGPAGHTAGIYLGRANLSPLMFEGDFEQEIAAGGLLTTTKIVENFPAFPDGIDGYELTERFKQQSTKFGLKILSESVKSIKINNDSNSNNQIFSVSTNTNDYLTKTIIIATGSTPNKLQIDSYDKFIHKGISTCAVCDAGLPCYRNVPIAVVGGGDSAMEEALHITHTASVVYLIHRRDTFRASKIMQDRVLNHPKIKIIWNTQIKEVCGTDFVEKLILVNNDLTESELVVSGLFVAVGHTPNSAFVKDIVELNSNGYIMTNNSKSTNIKGIWACGDVQDPHYKQAITAAATGCICALEVEKYLHTNS